MKRRDFLKVSFVAIVSNTIAACGGKKPVPTPTPLPAQPGVVKYTLLLTPGSPEEISLLQDQDTSVAVDSTRIAKVGNGWTYRLPISTRVSGSLTFECEQSLTVHVSDTSGVPLQTTDETTANLHHILFAYPDIPTDGAYILIKFTCLRETIVVKKIRLVLQLPDTNGDGIADSLALLMGVAVNEPVEINPLPVQPHTSFFYAGDYDPRFASPTDIVRLYTYSPTWTVKDRAS